MKLSDYYIDPEYASGKKPSPLFLHKLINNTSARKKIEELISDRDLNLPSHTRYTDHTTKSLTFQYSDPVYLHQQLKNARRVEHFFKKSGQSYLFNPDFLSKLCDSELKASAFETMSQEFNGYFAFSKGSEFYSHQGSAPVIGAYVFISKESPDSFDPMLTSEWTLSFLAIKEQNDPNAEIMPVGMKVTLNGLIYLIETGEFSDGMLKFDAKTRKLFQLLAMCVLYVLSGDPDLRHLRPVPGGMSPTKLKKIKAQGKAQDYSSEILVPVSLVSWGWKKPALYQKDQWEVCSYFKNVAYGPNHSQRKLMWFPPTIAHRQAELESSESKSP